MGALKGFGARLRALVHRGAAERELDEELRFHLDMETEKNVRTGMNPSDARRRALRDFGGVEVTKEAHRDVRGRWLEELAADTRYALRTLRRAPVLATAASAFSSAASTLRQLSYACSAAERSPLARWISIRRRWAASFKG